MNTIVTSVVRTIVPLIVGLVMNLLVRYGLDQLVDVEQINLVVSGVVTTVVTAVYYVAVRWLETFRSSKWGWLLGKCRLVADPKQCSRQRELWGYLSSNRMDVTYTQSRFVIDTS